MLKLRCGMIDDETSLFPKPTDIEVKNYRPPNEMSKPNTAYKLNNVTKLSLHATCLKLVFSSSS